MHEYGKILAFLISAILELLKFKHCTAILIRVMCVAAVADLCQTFTGETFYQFVLQKTSQPREINFILFIHKHPPWKILLPPAWERF